jgi:hypothetical protein
MGRQILRIKVSTRATQDIYADLLEYLVRDIVPV